jgi:hypothetical protein
MTSRSEHILYAASTVLMATCASILFIIFIGELHRDPFVALRDVSVTPDSVQWNGLCTFRVTVEVDGKPKSFMLVKPCTDTPPPATPPMLVDDQGNRILLPARDIILAPSGVNCVPAEDGKIVRKQSKDGLLPRLPPKKE